MSGGERLVPRAHVTTTASRLLARAASAGHTDRVTLTVDEISAGALVTAPALDVRTVCVADPTEGRALATAALRDLGVAEYPCGAAMSLLASGPSPNGGPMRGAVIMDHLSGSRLEPNSERGVRVSRVDMQPEDRARVRALAASERFVDALILASKVASLGCVIADLGWSDDPEYTPGYVASAARGYERFTHLKDTGSPFGGRVYFVDAATFDAAADVARLEAQPTVIALSEGLRLETVPVEIPGRFV
ncbi:6-carboxyhexanoate--CoA ligase [Candidatus Poribacteria bacterium]|nr:6-carboxyhexanoate--CoA ligase [Candidatus Poribacteria bacterium]MBT5709711.1 6-carboxyhexanoate--CoA ligase [Candidatus Poribacteria bacterium]MBT7101567.1 6-carboxyhexanoate--CoA ligase [Candidatus Poribacteria bacterium]